MASKRSSRKAASQNPSAASSNQAGAGDHQALFPVVGIGASAGGLDAFTQLFSNLPADTGMAFVLIQHLDPTQKSLLSEIMARITQMPVQEVEDDVVVLPNQVYVIPPNTIMTILAGRLKLQPLDPVQRSSKAVDAFFNALAVERGNRAIGVVLSGGDADGSLGLEAIKAAGGITFAQSEDSAQVRSMPHMAIATGRVDFILPPEEIAQTLASISHHPYITSPTSATPPATLADGQDALTSILGLLKVNTQVDFAQYKPTTLKRRIFRRMALHRLEQLDDYWLYLQGNPTEVQALYQEILINVTSFFRDPEAFDRLKHEVFPSLHRDRAPEDPIRIWVAGCSTGEEAYSIAICLLEYWSDQAWHPPIQIFATDVNERAIETARLGIYSTDKVLDVSPERLARFFMPIEGGYQISQAVRELCIFAQQNLVRDPPFSRMDLISCRNILIYFGATLQKRVLLLFHYGLKSSGFLMLGSSETVGEFADLFTLLDRKHRIYARQSSALRLNIDLGTSSDLSETSPPRSHQGGAATNDDLSWAADQIVLNRYGPVGVVVNTHLEILQFRGQTGAYLELSPGRASLNLLNMAKTALRLDLRAAIHQAKQLEQAVCRGPIPLQEGDRLRQVQVDVVPFKPTQAEGDYFLVLFKDTAILAETAGSGRLPSPSLTSEDSPLPLQVGLEVQRLQQELETTRSHLQSIIQEQDATNQDLRAANEEVLSSNEELQSTNEELQTAKEEIQATNEELSTINDELCRRNAETTRISDDFQNLLSSINIPILMLEGDLRIRRFTPAAATLFNLIPTDAGRLLSDIKHRLSIVDLEQQILEVIDTLDQKSLEVQDQVGCWYDLRIRPYRTLDNRIDGAIVVLVDIDTLKRSAEKLRESRDFAEMIVQTMREALLVLNADLQVVMANSQFYRTFQVQPSEVEHRQIFELGNGQWNIPQLRSLLEDLLPQDQQIYDFEVVHKFEYIGTKTMLLNASKMTQVTGQELILLAIEDISDRT